MRIICNNSAERYSDTIEKLDSKIIIRNSVGSSKIIQDLYRAGEYEGIMYLDEGTCSISRCLNGLYRPGEFEKMYSDTKDSDKDIINLYRMDTKKPMFTPFGSVGLPDYNFLFKETPRPDYVIDLFRYLLKKFQFVTGSVYSVKKISIYQYKKDGAFEIKYNVGNAIHVINCVYNGKDGLCYGFDCGGSLNKYACLKGDELLDKIDKAVKYFINISPVPVFRAEYWLSKERDGASAPGKGKKYYIGFAEANHLNGVIDRGFRGGYIQGEYVVAILEDVESSSFSTLSRSFKNLFSDK